MNGLASRLSSIAMDTNPNNTSLLWRWSGNVFLENCFQAVRFDFALRYIFDLIKPVFELKRILDSVPIDIYDAYGVRVQIVVSNWKEYNEWFEVLKNRILNFKKIKVNCLSNLLNLIWKMESRSLHRTFWTFFDAINEVRLYQSIKKVEANGKN